MSQINSCPIMLPMSGDPAIIQLGSQIQKLQQYFSSGNNLSSILNSSNISLGAIPVYVTQVGGLNGDDTGPSFPTYTYNVYQDSSRTILLAIAASPVFHRPLQIAVHPGTYGLAIKVTGTWYLLFTDEYFDRDECPADTFGVA